jgi:hypothetical protein
MKRRMSSADVEDTRAQLIPCSVRLQPDLHELRHARAWGTSLLERNNSALVVGELKRLLDPSQGCAVNLSLMRLYFGDPLDVCRVPFFKYP